MKRHGRNSDHASSPYRTMLNAASFLYIKKDRIAPLLIRPTRSRCSRLFRHLHLAVRTSTSFPYTSYPIDMGIPGAFGEDLHSQLQFYPLIYSR
ncbi:hypothetical protein M404DRAFT_996547 [Pisolithus tinctorius Marx 270]|uniref:Uncharacterized protein n=1 Tax=Pisolithus tinctorius Marx 270 TaxID=870435 RepID=A0A0C3PLT3_PISTI|nr:hypothetical protein M404DRAFT_996547 [Pisolithus tinctorius Marx 270]